MRGFTSGCKLWPRLPAERWPLVVEESRRAAVEAGGAWGAVQPASFAARRFEPDIKSFSDQVFAAASQLSLGKTAEIAALIARQINKSNNWLFAG